eukprot:jgi/Chlat1/2369/Chrsp17S02637
MNYEAILIDCDGTLVDSEPWSCEAVHQAILQVTGLDVPHQFPTDYIPVFGLDARNTLALIGPVVAAKEKIYFEQLTANGELKAFPGVTELVNKANELGLQVAVASSSEPPKIRHNLTQANIDKLFPDESRVVSAVEVAHGKPAPDIYLEAMKRCGVSDPAKCIVLEDAIAGLQSGKAAGMLVPHADIVVSSMLEIDLQSLPPLAEVPRHVVPDSLQTA